MSLVYAVAVRSPKIKGFAVATGWRAPRRLSNSNSDDDDFQPLRCSSRPCSHILGACAQSGALEALPVSARRSADRMSPNVAGELAEHDAAVEELYRQLIVKASKASSASQSQEA